MNEQEYEKSLDIPMANALVQSGHIGTVVCVDSKHFERLAEERVFARGVWKAFATLRDRVAQIHNIAHDADLVIGCVIKPIPDAPKPDPRSKITFQFVNEALSKAEKCNLPLAKDVADEIIREVRARTVK